MHALNIIRIGLMLILFLTAISFPPNVWCSTLVIIKLLIYIIIKLNNQYLKELKKLLKKFFLKYDKSFINVFL